MIKPAAMIDACVLHQEPTRDFLLSVAAKGGFSPLWSGHILRELKTSLIRRFPEKAPERFEKVIQAMKAAFLESVVEDYEPLISGIQIPDLDDRHVVAAAIKGGVDFIITNNTRDFPRGYILDNWDIEVLTPDEFVLYGIANFPLEVHAGMIAMLARLRNPPKTAEEIIESIERQGLTSSGMKLRELMRI